MWFLVVIVLSISPHQTKPIAMTKTYGGCLELKRAEIANVRPFKQSFKLDCQQ